MVSGARNKISARSFVIYMVPGKRYSNYAIFCLLKDSGYTGEYVYTTIRDAIKYNLDRGYVVQRDGYYYLTDDKSVRMQLERQGGKYRWLLRSSGYSHS